MLIFGLIGLVALVAFLFTPPEPKPEDSILKDIRETLRDDRHPVTGERYARTRDQVFQAPVKK